MINFVSTDKKSGVVIGIGFNHDDLDRLYEGQFITLKVSDMGIDISEGVEMEIKIFGGNNDDQMIEDLRLVMGPELKLWPGVEKGKLN
jgi:hypothetical protein